MATCSGCGVEDHNGLGLANLIEVGMSADMFLGVPFNIASYALLTLMIAQVVGMEPGDFIWTGGDCHLYANHVDQAEEMLLREPLPLPRVKLRPSDKEIENFEWESIELINYKHHPRISAPMAK